VGDVARSFQVIALLIFAEPTPMTLLLNPDKFLGVLQLLVLFCLSAG
jgi:hypothetical protein